MRPGGVYETRGDSGVINLTAVFFDLDLIFAIVAICNIYIGEHCYAGR